MSETRGREVPEWMSGVVEAAIRAPSGGNNQPWKFFAEGEVLHVVNDRARASSPTLDVGERATYAALGAAVENIVIAAAERGRKAEVRWLPEPQNELVVARISFSEGGEEELAADAGLAEFVGQRLTNRRVSKRKPIPDEDLGRLSQATRLRGGELHVCVDDAGLRELADVIGESDGLRVFSDALRSEMMNELRWSQEEAERTRDGIDLATLEISKGQKWMISMLRSPRVARTLETIGFTRGLVAGARKMFAGSSAFAVVTIPGTSPAEYLQGGRAIQRVWLEATRLGLALQPLAAVTYLFMRVRFFGGEGLSADMKTQLERLYKRFSRVLPGIEGRRGHVLYFRLGYAGPATARSLRRPLDEVLFMGPPSR